MVSTQQWMTFLMGSATLTLVAFPLQAKEALSKSSSHITLFSTSAEGLTSTVVNKDSDVVNHLSTSAEFQLVADNEPSPEVITVPEFETVVFEAGIKEDFSDKDITSESTQDALLSINTIDASEFDASAIAFEASMSTTAEDLLEETKVVEAVVLEEDLYQSLEDSPEIAQVGRSRASDVAPFYVGIGGNIGIIESDNSAVGDFAFNIISKASLGPRFAIRPTASISGDDVSVAIPVTYNFDPIQFGQIIAYPSLGAGVDIAGNIGLLVNGGVDVPIARDFTLNGQVNWRVTDDLGLGVSLGVAYNLSFFSE